jgi:hypothetical protein
LEILNSLIRIFLNRLIGIIEDAFDDSNRPKPAPNSSKKFQRSEKKLKMFDNDTTTRRPQR